MEHKNHSAKEVALSNWSKEDKVNLLLALKVHNSKNIKEIREYVPNKTNEQIQTAINFYKMKAIQIKENNSIIKEKSKTLSSPRVPLASWAEFLTNSLNYKELQTETASAIRLISELENIPPPACTEGIDIRKIYLHIANAMEGKPVPQREDISCILRKCNLETALISKAFIRNTAYKYIIDNVKISEEELNAFPKATNDHELYTIRHLASQRKYNPLNISEEYLKPSISRAVNHYKTSS